MKKLKLTFLNFFALIIIISLLSACSTQKDADISYDSGTSNKLEDIGDGDIASDTRSKEGPGILEGEKVISTYYMNLETLDFKKSRDDLDNLMKKHKAFVENSNVSFRGYEYNKNYRYGDFSIRIPKENVDKFKTEIKKVGNITNESTSKEDVTNSYRDTESRLKLVTSKEKRLLSLLEKAVKVEDIIAIESELTNTIYEKEMLEKDLKSVDEKIEYANLNLELIEVRNFSSIDKSDSSLSLRLKNAFKDSLFAFKVAIENFIIWLVFALPYLIIIVPLAVLAILFIKRRRNKS